MKCIFRYLGVFALSVALALIVTMLWGWQMQKAEEGAWREGNRFGWEAAMQQCERDHAENAALKQQAK